MKFYSPKVVGCGGIASWLLPPLAHYLAYIKKGRPEITLIDGDSFEEKNRDRQVFQEIGNKAEVTAERLRKDYRNVFFWTQPHYLTNDNATLLIREDDVIFACVDNYKTRQLISQRAEELDNIIVISGGNFYTDGSVQIHVKRNGHNISLPIGNKFHPEILHAKDKNPGEQETTRQGCQEMIASEPQLLFMNNAIATTMLNCYYALSVEGELVQGKQCGEVGYDEAYVDILMNAVVPTYRSKPKPKPQI